MGDGDLTERFTRAYDHQLWYNVESVSGPGSTLDYTVELRATLPALLRALGCGSLLDAPCGDFNWMSKVDLAGIEYTGADIVPAMIAALQARWPDTRFLVLDICRDPLPRADFMLCRDVLFHLANADIRHVLEGFAQSGSAWFATSHSPHITAMPDVDSDPLTFREVNLTAPPFSIAQPDYTLKDWWPGFPQRWLGVWPRSAIAARFGG